MKKPARILTWIAAALAAAAVCYIVYLQVRIITNPSPIEYREGAIVLSTEALVRGENPYALNNLPATTNVYGIGYNLLVLPLATMFGNGFAVHRAVSCVCLVACCVVLGRGVYRGRRHALLVFAVAVLLYADLGARVTLGIRPFAAPLSTISRPDALAMLLFLISMIVPWKWRFSTGSLIVGGLASCAAFFTKPYFVIGFPIVVLYLVLGHSRKVGLISGVAFAVTMALAASIVSSLAPWYFTIIVKVNNASVTPSYDHLLLQLALYARSVPGMLCILLVAGYIGIRRTIRIGLAERRKLRVSFPGFALVICLGLLVGKLGPHDGNSMLYFYQLFTPFLLWIVIQFLQRQPRAIYIGLICLDYIILFATGLSAPPRSHAETWAQWREFIESHNSVYTPPPLAWTVGQQGKPVYDTGMSEYAKLAVVGKRGDGDEALRDRVLEFGKDMNAKIVQQQFDRIVVTLTVDGRAPAPPYGLPRLIQNYYRVERVMELPMDWSPGFRGAILMPKAPEASGEQK